MTRIVLALMFSVVTTTAVLGFPQLTDTDVAQAIAAGQNRRFRDLSATCVATVDSFTLSTDKGIRPTGGFDVTVSGNRGRIALLAADAKRSSKALTAVDIPDSLRNPAIFVLADPRQPSKNKDTIQVASPIDSIVLKSETAGALVVRPESFDTEPVEWTNVMGETVVGTRGLARFSYTAVATLPDGDFDVVVSTKAGERACKVRNKDRTKLR